MNDEERKKLAEIIRNLKPGQSLTVALESKQEAEKLQQQISSQ